MQKHKKEKKKGWGAKDGNWLLNPLCVYVKGTQEDTKMLLRSAVQHEDV